MAPGRSNLTPNRKATPMGEYADFIINSAIDGDPVAGYHAIDDYNKDRNGERFRQALKDFPEAAKLAKAAGLELIKHDEFHYKLKTPWGKYELYPGRCLIKRNERGPAVPHLPCKSPWRLGDVVQSAVKMAAQYPDGGDAT